MTSSQTPHGQADDNRDSKQREDPPTPSYPITVHEERLRREYEDTSKDKEASRQIQINDAASLRNAREWFVKSTLVIAFGVFFVGSTIVFGHKDQKIRELGVSVVSAPIAFLFGVIAGMPFK